MPPQARRCRGGTGTELGRDAVTSRVAQICPWELSHLVCSLAFAPDKTLSDQSCLFTGVHILMTVKGEVEYQKGSSSAMVANRSDNWDDEAAEDDGHMSDLVRVSQTCSKVTLEQLTLSFR